MTRQFALPARSSPSASILRPSPDCWGAGGLNFGRTFGPLRSKGYLIFFRYLPSDTDRQIFEVANVVESHRDLIAYFADAD